MENLIPELIIALIAVFLAGILKRKVRMTKLQEDAERETFEAWASDNQWSLSCLADKVGAGAPRAGEYRHTGLQDAWETWQAALRQGPQPRPDHIEDVRGMVPSRDEDALIDAAEAHAALYDGDPRDCIATDVMNAFYAGAAFIQGHPASSQQVEKPLLAATDNPLRITPGPVCWFKHGPYESGEPLQVVFTDPLDDDLYSPLGFIDVLAQPVQNGELPEITTEDKQWLHYNPNTSDIVDWIQDYARQAIALSGAHTAPVVSDEWIAKVIRDAKVLCVHPEAATTRDIARAIIAALQPTAAPVSEQDKP